MSLATRCTECQTTFKVVQDQLKVSRGWVRCGHCQQVFNALENMFDIDEPNVQHVEPPPPAAPIETEPAPSTLPAQAKADTSIELDFPDLPAPPTAPTAMSDNVPDSVVNEDKDQVVTQPQQAPSTDSFAVDEQDLESLRWANLMPPPADDTPLERSLPPPSQRRGRSGTRGRLPPPVEPTFVKQAERAAIWQHPVIKGFLWVLLLGLLLALAGQSLLQWRNEISAYAPATKPWLAQLCIPFDCTVTAPKNLSRLQVESVTVVKVESRGPDAYQLTVLIRNSGDSDAQWPQLDLTLNDINGQTLTRRDLSVSTAKQVPADDNHGKPASQFWPVPAAVEPGLIALQWQLQAPNMKLAGYTAELFYP